MRSIVLIGVLGGVLAGCAAETGQEASSQTQNSRASAAPRVALKAPRVAELPRALSQIARLPDRGTLLAYGDIKERRGAYTLREVKLSEAHAISAIENGGMVVEGPDGAPIRLEYERHVGHPGGNWTWVGRPAGAQPGTEAILTFGPNAVFGTIPTRDNRQVEISTRNGRTWMVEADPNVQANTPSDAFGDSDYVAMPTAEAVSKAVASKASRPTLASSGAQTFTSAAASPTGTFAGGTSGGVTIDLAIGYTATFATRLGGTSQAITRLNSMVDIANQGFINSQVGGKLRIARTVQVTFPDDTTNRSALMALTGLTCTNTGGTGQRYLPEGGVNCTAGTVNAALQPLIAARDAVGADLAILVRQFVSPANQSCGIGWLIGGAQAPIGSDSLAFGLAVVSDSSGMTFPSNGATCRQETLGHEVGHNLGIQHDRATAGGADDTNTDGQALDPEEFGRYPYAFGHKSDAMPGAFYDIMSVPTAGINQVGYRVFSNPRLTSCGGQACGLPNLTDASFALGQTFPLIAAFRAPRFPISGVGYRGDYDGDGRSDIFWHNPLTDANAYWRSGNAATAVKVTSITDKAWTVVGGGDFDGDGKSDLLFRHVSLGRNAIWRSANSATASVVTTMADPSWIIAGIGDFDGDHKSDILWRNVVNGNNTIWRSANSTTVTNVARVADLEYTVAAVADFDGDGKSDILWRNRNDGRNAIWRSGNAGTASVVTAVSPAVWSIVGAGDFNGDGKADILWRNASTGANQYWRSGDSRLYVAVASAPAQWLVVGIGDFDNDGKDDVLWRNSANGTNTIWRSANGSTPQAVSPVASQFWIVSG